MPVRENPYPNHHFLVDLGGGGELAFAEAELPSGQVEVLEYREGADKTSAARKLPGRVSYPNVTLRRGVTGRMDLADWWREAANGLAPRRNVTISLLNEQHEPVQRWVLLNAWPAKLSWSRLDALGNEVVIESLELAHEGFATE